MTPTAATATTTPRRKQQQRDEHQEAENTADDYVDVQPAAAVVIGRLLFRPGRYRQYSDAVGGNGTAGGGGGIAAGGSGTADGGSG